MTASQTCALCLYRHSRAHLFTRGRKQKNPANVERRKIGADAAIMNPVANIIALKGASPHHHYHHLLTPPLLLLLPLLLLNPLPAAAAGPLHLFLPLLRTATGCFHSRHVCLSYGVVHFPLALPLIWRGPTKSTAFSYHLLCVVHLPPALPRYFAAGRTLQIFNLDLKEHNMPVDVPFWSWINETTVALVTETYVSRCTPLSACCHGLYCSPSFADVFVHCTPVVLGAPTQLRVCLHVYIHGHVSRTMATRHIYLHGHAC